MRLTNQVNCATFEYGGSGDKAPSSRMNMDRFSCNRDIALAFSIILGKYSKVIFLILDHLTNHITHRSCSFHVSTKQHSNNEIPILKSGYPYGTLVAWLRCQSAKKQLVKKPWGESWRPKQRTLDWEVILNQRLRNYWRVVQNEWHLIMPLIQK